MLRCETRSSQEETLGPELRAESHMGVESCPPVLALRLPKAASILEQAPWEAPWPSVSGDTSWSLGPRSLRDGCEVTPELLDELCITRVVSGSVTKIED